MNDDLKLFAFIVTVFVVSLGGFFWGHVAVAVGLRAVTADIRNERSEQDGKWMVLGSREDLAA